MTNSHTVVKVRNFAFRTVHLRRQGLAVVYYVQYLVLRYIYV